MHYLNMQLLKDLATAIEEKGLILNVDGKFYEYQYMVLVGD